MAARLSASTFKRAGSESGPIPIWFKCVKGIFINWANDKRPLPSAQKDVAFQKAGPECSARGDLFSLTIFHPK
eukprot:8782173-Ditylum_brightwellii.AAC.1